MLRLLVLPILIGVHLPTDAVFQDIALQMAQPVQEAGIDHFHFPKSFTIDLR